MNSRIKGVSDISTVYADEKQMDLYMLEDDSWWFQYRSRIIVSLMDLFLNKRLMTVDVGGGNGYTSSVAKNSGYKVSLLEPSPVACKNARERGIDAVEGMLTESYPNNGSYEQVLLLDVLEHIENDFGYASLLHRKMKQGGRVLITVPAYMVLWSSEDVYSGHFRRYNKRKLQELLEISGFSTVYCGCFMFFLVVPILIFRVLFEKAGIVKTKDRRSREEVKQMKRRQFVIRKRGIVTGILSLLESLELSVIKAGRHIPFGSSIIIVAQRN